MTLPPPILRPIGVGFFEYGPPTSPGNWYAQVGPIGAPEPEVFLYARDGRRIAQYVAAEQPGQTIAGEVAAARRRHPDLPIIPYWPRGDQPGPVPPGDYIGVEAYRGVSESIEGFERRLEAATFRCPRAILLPQCYTSNLANTPDLPSILPVVLRVAAAFPTVVGLLAFSGAGRRTGLGDHPEVQGCWQTVADRAPAAPPALSLAPPPPTRPPAPFLVPARTYRGHMRIYARLSGRYVGCDPVDAAHAVYADRLQGQAWEAILLTKHADGSFDARFEAAGRQLTLTPDGRLESRPAGAVGAWETFFATAQPDGSAFLYRIDGGRLVLPVLQIEAA